jgi:hypothetical protein
MPRKELALLAVSVVSLLAGLWAALVLLGFHLPPLRPAFPADHAPLMVVGFLGTLIGLERAVSLRRPWTYLGPAATGLAALVLLAGLPGAPLFAALGGLGMTAIFVTLWRRTRAAHTAAMLLGALCFLGGNLLWLGGVPLAALVPWWIAFLLLTIAGERLELSRLVALTLADRAVFWAAAGLVTLGTVWSLLAPAGVRLAGAGLALLAGWLLTRDVARRTVRQAGVTRFIALGLLAGFCWLGVAGALLLAFGPYPPGLILDAQLHAFFLGFVLSMIFAHAPIVFPAVLRRPLPFAPRFYAHLALLHLSLLLRVGADLAGWPPGQYLGGVLNVVAVLAFLANTLWSVRRGRVVPREDSSRAEA